MFGHSVIGILTENIKKKRTALFIWNKMKVSVIPKVLDKLSSNKSEPLEIEDKYCFDAVSGEF